VRRAALGLLALAAVWLGALALADGVAAVLALVPTLAVLLPLVAGRYPLERTIERLRRCPARRRAPGTLRVPRPRPRTRAGWLLVACTGWRGPPCRG
jgi:hypothetical protein